MEIQVVTDEFISDAFWEAMEAAAVATSDTFTGASLVAKHTANDRRVLLLGPRPEWVTDEFEVYEAPSVRAIMGTAGGVTKLKWALKRMAEGKALELPPYEWQVYFPGVALPTDALVAFDIEVSGDIRVDEPEDTELLSCVLTWFRHGDETLQGVVLPKARLADPAVRDELRKVLESNRLLTHNGKFDLRWVNALLGTNLYPAEDTMLKHHAMYPGAGEHGLKPLAHRILGAPDWETGLEKYTKGKAHYERIPADILNEYNAWDGYYTYLLNERLDALMDDDAIRLYREHTLPASHMLQDVEAHGLAVDVEYGEQLGELLDEQIDDLKDRLTPYVANPGSTKQVAETLHRDFRKRVNSTNEKTLMSMVGRDDELDAFIADLLEYRSATKARSTYVTSILKKVRRGRVHPTFLVHGTSTGRLSSSGPNVQNITNDEEGKPSVRRMFTVAPGCIGVGADYSQAELRTTAELCGDPLMIADLQEGAPDFFDNMMPHVFPDEDFTVMDKAHRKPFRLRLKRVVYGSAYGLTPPSIARMLTLEGSPTTVEEAEIIQANYLDHYPELQRWREETMPLVLAGDELITPFGRRFQQDVVTDSNFLRVQNQAWAFRPQSIASDICLRAAMAVHGNLKRDFPGWSIFALVHDAIYADGPDEPGAGDEVLAMIQREMRASAALTFSRVPFLTDGHTGYFWNEL